MERAFFHTSEGVWIAIDDPSPEILASYPAGTQEIPLPPGPDHQWTGDAWVHIPPGPPPVPQAVSRFQALEAAVQAHIDATARARGYRHGDSAALHALDPRPEWAAEGAAFTAWRSAVWSFVYDWLAQVQAGEAAPPESAEALIAALPPMVWP